MKRDLNELSHSPFDVVVVGGGIFGICATWEAVTRGLSVALVEKDDFVGATSANCFKIAHGGIRYLQHLDFYRMRQSCKERQILLRIAPHLVTPLPILVPTFGRGMQSKSVLRLGCAVYDALNWNRNNCISDPQRQIPAAYSLSSQECLDRFPGLAGRTDLTGGVVFHDGQIHNPPRLGLAMLRSAVELGACAANYLEASELLEKDGRIIGVRVNDRIGEGQFDVRGRLVINAAGPWAPQLLGRQFPKPDTHFSRDAAFMLRQNLTDGLALAVPASTSDPDAVLSRSHRHLFLVPWRDRTMIGVWHKFHQGKPEDCQVSEAELTQFIDEVSDAYPALDLSLDDVTMVLSGLVPCDGMSPDDGHLRFGKRSRIIDHGRESGLQGLITIIGVRYTTARCEAKRVVEMARKKLQQSLRPSTTDSTAVWGGGFDGWQELLDHARQKYAGYIPKDVTDALVRNYGASFESVLKFADEQSSLSECLDQTTITKAEVLHAVREEMAVKLSDVVFRRTELATADKPTQTAIDQGASLIAEELGWDNERKNRELDDVCQTLRAKTVNEVLSSHLA